MSRSIQSAAGLVVTLTRGADSVDNVAATDGASKFEVVTADGTVLNFQSVDFLILATDYDFGTGPVLPARADRIEKPDGGGVLTYEVVSQPGVQPYRFCDAARTLLRVHTKQVKAAT